MAWFIIIFSIFIIVFLSDDACERRDSAKAARKAAQVEAQKHWWSRNMSTWVSIWRAK